MKTLKVLLYIIVIILLLPLVGYIGWQLRKGQRLEIIVVNKSLIKYNGSENKSMNYILDCEKVFNRGKRTYDLKVDHIGLHWNNGEYQIKYPRLSEVSRVAEKADLVYYADASGIMCSQVKKLKTGDEDHLEYGGLNNTDYTLIKELISLEKPLIVECNFYCPPTEALVRYNLEKLTDIYYVGWIGKYLRDLEAEVTAEDHFNWKKLYEEYTGKQYNFSGSGIVFINNEAKRMLVLEEGKHIETTNGLIVSTSDAVENHRLPERTNYCGWFTLLHPGRNEVLSKFELNVTESGQVMINEEGIPSDFPALIMADKNFYFMAGDFGKAKTSVLFRKVALIRPVFDLIKRSSKKSSNFFYTYYQPFMTGIIKDIKKKKAEEE
ncbi:hypothetical protein ACFLRQ_02220 [Bacteroidota bacterium]